MAGLTFVMAEGSNKIDGWVQKRTTDPSRTDADLRSEIEERTLAEGVLRQLSHRIVQLQDEERRRIARELHDSIGQALGAIAMGVALLDRRAPPELRPEIEEILKQIDTCTKEVRTISHLLHPPLLEQVGLSAALQGYVGEFSRRSGIHVDLEILSELARMKPEVETAIFRIVQEGLTNIHRHSGAHEARISIARHGGTLRINISDNGRGISKETLKRIATAQSGVGVTGMRERVKHLGGTFQIRSNHPGTVLAIELPFAPA